MKRIITTLVVLAIITGTIYGLVHFKVIPETAVQDMKSVFMDAETVKTEPLTVPVLPELTPAQIADKCGTTKP